MYGIIQECLKEWLVEAMGEEAWTRIVTAVKLQESSFLRFRNYPDDVTTSILDAACGITGLDKEILLERLGHYFLPYAFQHGYGDMVLSLGNTLESFLANVDYLHWYLMSTAYPEILSPSFCLDIDPDGAMLLSYYSQRAGFHPLAVGLIQAIAFHIFGLNACFSTVSQETETLKPGKKLFSVVFRVVCTDTLPATCMKEAELASSIFNSMNLRSGKSKRLGSKFNSQGRASASLTSRTHLPLSRRPASASAAAFVTLRKTPLPDGGVEGSEDANNEMEKKSVTSGQNRTACARTSSCPCHLARKDTPDDEKCGRNLDDERLCARAIRDKEKGELGAPPSVALGEVDGKAGALPPNPFIRSLHPYHVLFDKELQVQGMGKALTSLMEEEDEEQRADEGSKTPERSGKRRPTTPLLPEVFDLVWPDVPLTYFNLSRFWQLVIQLKLRRTRAAGLELKGELLWWTDQMILFVGSPLVRSLEELRLSSLCVADLPKHDSTRELVLLKHQRTTEFDLMKQLEETTAQLQGTAKALEEEKARTDLLLEMMVPPSVALKLKNGEKVQESFGEVTVMFADVVKFTAIAAQCTPLQVVDMLNLLYMKFDARTEECNVYKVETIGDAYMVVGGAPVQVSDHAERVARLALAIIGEASTVPDPVSGMPLQVRAGMHSGPVVAGCVGVKMPRYCLFGDTVNTASRMEAYSLPGKVHLTRQTYNLLKGRNYKFTQREKLNIKGKGTMVTYFLDSGPAATGLPSWSPSHAVQVKEPRSPSDSVPDAAANTPGAPTVETGIKSSCISLLSFPSVMRASSAVHPAITVTKSTTSASSSTDEIQVTVNSHGKMTRKLSPNICLNKPDEAITVSPCSDKVSDQARSPDSANSDPGRVCLTNKPSRDLPVLQSEFFIPHDNKNQGQSKNNRTKKTINCKSSVCVII